MPPFKPDPGHERRAPAVDRCALDWPARAWTPGSPVRCVNAPKCERCHNWRPYRWQDNRYCHQNPASLRAALWSCPKSGNSPMTKLKSSFPQRSLPFILLASWCSIATAEPVIESVVFQADDHSRLVISGREFTPKSNPRPLFWWTADGGEAPSGLGRLTAWSGHYSSRGGISDDFYAPGSTTSYKFDHGETSGAALGRVDFDSDRLFMWRKKYDDFDVTENYAIRTRFDSATGELRVGQLVTGLVSRTTGVIRSVNDNGNGTGSIYYERSQGSVADGADFVDDEIIRTSSGQARVNEAWGTLRSFNYKVARMWSTNNGQRNSVYPAAQGVNGPLYFVSPEGTNGTIWVNDPRLSQQPREWVIEQILYSASGLDAQNGLFLFSINNRFVYEDPIVTRTSDRPWKYAQLFQTQVSNGAEPGSIVYYDSLYVDDSWHRVVLSTADRWRNARDIEVQIPFEWSDNSIIAHIRLGSLDGQSELFVYVVDSQDRANREGFPIDCSQCPRPPLDFSVR